MGQGIELICGVYIKYREDSLRDMFDLRFCNTVRIALDWDEMPHFHWMNENERRCEQKRHSCDTVGFILKQGLAMGSGANLCSESIPLRIYILTTYYPYFSLSNIDNRVNRLKTLESL